VACRTRRQGNIGEYENGISKGTAVGPIDRHVRRRSPRLEPRPISGFGKRCVFTMRSPEALRADGESQQQAFSKVIMEDETGRLLYQACATWRLNSMLWERCLAMAFILQKPSHQVNSLGPNSPASGAHSIQTSFELSTFFPAAAPAQSVLPCSEPQIISNHPNFESTTS
jgi:hypothetical protein